MTLPPWMTKTKDGALALKPADAPPALLAELEALGAAPEAYSVRLPAWAEMRHDGVIVVDPEVAYPAILADLERAGCKPETAELDQFWVECAYQIAKMELQRVMRRYGFTIKILKRPAWAMKALPVGAGVEPATKGKMAKAYYKRLRDLA